MTKEAEEITRAKKDASAKEIQAYRWGATGGWD